MACITKTWLAPEEMILFSEMCLARYQMWHNPGTEDNEDGINVVTQEDVAATSGATIQMSSGETLFLKVGSRDQLGLLLSLLAVYQFPCLSS